MYIHIKYIVIYINYIFIHLHLHIHMGMCVYVYVYYVYFLDTWLAGYLNITKVSRMAMNNICRGLS